MTFKLLLILIIILRIGLTVLPSLRIDMNSWQAWATRLTEVDPVNFYTPGYFADYSPGYLYFLWIFGLIFNFLRLEVFSTQFAIFLKITTTFFDLATAYMIYKIVTNYERKIASIATVLYLVNPAVIFNSSVWGQVDGILTFFLCLAFYLLLEKRSIYGWSLVASVALLIKPQAIVVFPVKLIYLLKSFSKEKILGALTALALFTMVIALPFFVNDPFFGLFKKLQESASGYPYTSVFAFNFWSIMGWWINDTNIWFFTTYQKWGFILYSLVLIVLIYPLLKKGINKPPAYFVAALFVFAFYLFPTRIHERYLFPFFAFFLIYSATQKAIMLFIIYIILSLIHLSNLWYVYYYYNVIYNNPNYTGFWLFEFLDHTYKSLAILLIVIFCILTASYYRNFKKLK